MDFEAIKMLTARQDQIMAELLRTYPTAEPLLATLRDTTTALRVISSPLAAPLAAPAAGRTNLAHVDEAAEAVAILLREEMQPMELHGIVQALVARGWGQAKADPARAIKTAITMHMKGHTSQRNFVARFALFDGRIGLAAWTEKKGKDK